MTGILFAQGSAILQAFQNILNKKLVKNEDTIVVIWFTLFMSMFFLSPLVLLDGIPEITEDFWVYLFLRLVIDTAALSLYFYALKQGDVSLVVPLSTFSVVFSLLSSAVVNGELPNILGIVGVFIVLVGTYFLSLPEKGLSKDVLLPVKLLFSDVAARLILLSALLYGIIYSINKAGIESSSTSFFTFSAAAGLLVIFTFVNVINKGKHLYFKPKWSKLKVFALLGAIDGVKIFLFMLAVANTFVAFADASDNTTAIYSTVFAGVAFNESIKKRLFPIFIMIFGVVIITISAYFSL